MAALRGAEPVLSRDAVILEQMASSEDTRGSGVILPALVSSADSFFASGCTCCAFAIYGHNQAPNRIRGKLEKEMTFETSITRNFLKRRQSV